MRTRTETTIKHIHVISGGTTAVWRGAIALATVIAIFATVGVARDAVAATSARTVTVTSGSVVATVTLATANAMSGQKVGVAVDFNVGPGWHIYGQPLPEDYQPTAVKFDDNLVASQSMDFPKPTPVEFKVLHQTLPVYQGNFNVPGTLLLKNNLAPGEHELGGTLSFQECNDELCKMPRNVRFQLPITIQSPSAAAK